MRSLAATGSIALVTFLAALPWGIPAEFRLTLPLLPFLAIYYWTLRRIELVPEVLVFAAGLTFDFLSDGPLGFWALIYLAGYALTLRAATSLLAGSAPGRLLLLAGSLLTLSVVEVSVSSIYFNTTADWWPPLSAAIIALLLYPGLAALLHPIGGPPSVSAASRPAWGRDA